MKERAPRDTLVGVIQAHDMDGDGLTFRFVGELVYCTTYCSIQGQNAGKLEKGSGYPSHKLCQKVKTFYYVIYRICLIYGACAIE